MPSSREQRRVAERHLPPLDAADDALAGRSTRSRRPSRGGCRARRRRRRSPPPAGARCRARARRRGAAARPRRRPRRWRRPPASACPAVSVPVLSTTSVSTSRSSSMAVGVLEQHAGAGALAGGDHDRHRGGEAERAGAGDDEHRDGVDDGVGERRRRPPDRPRGEGEQRRRRRRSARTRRRRGRRGAGWARGCAAPRPPSARSGRAACRRRRVAPRMIRAPVPFRVPPMTAAPAVFSTGIGSPVTIDSSTALRPSITDAVDRDALAGAHAQAVADAHLGERHVALAAVGVDAARGGRRQLQQRADGGSGAAARAQLQHLAEQHQGDDDGGRLEVDADAAVHAAERGGEDPAAPPSRRRCSPTPRRRRGR